MMHPRFGFECAACGNLRPEVPDDPQECTLIHCGNCRTLLGKWGQIQNIFLAETEGGAFELTRGQIKSVLQRRRPCETRFEMAFRHVYESTGRVARQRELVDELRKGGFPIDNAEKLLA